jgi:hypothetical protein
MAKQSKLTKTAPFEKDTGGLASSTDLAAKSETLSIHTSVIAKMVSNMEKGQPIMMMAVFILVSIRMENHLVWAGWIIQMATVKKECLMALI